MGLFQLGDLFLVVSLLSFQIRVILSLGSPLLKHSHPFNSIHHQCFVRFSLNLLHRIRASFQVNVAHCWLFRHT